jgi:hypothetical protein
MTRAVLWLLLSVTMLACLGCETAKLRPGATSIFEFLAPPTPEEAAKMAIDRYDADKRYRGTQLLASAPFAGEPVYVELFKDNVDDEDPGVRAVAVRALGMHGGPEHVPLLVDRLKDEDVGVRIASGRALQRLHNPVAIDALLVAINPENEPEAAVRVEAASALGQYAENRVVEALIASFTDESLAVNVATRDSLRTLTGQDFGLDPAAWQVWYKDTRNLFTAQSVYTYPVFQRHRRWFEYIPFVPQPPYEPIATPAGLRPGL